MVIRISPHYREILLSKYIQNFMYILLVTILLVFTSSLMWSDSAQAVDAFGCYKKIGMAVNCPNSPKPSLVGSMEGSNCLLGETEDWHTTTQTVGESNVTVLSFHGGNIEPGTSKISEDLQTLYNWNRYDFKGHVINQACKDLKTTLNPSCTVGDTFCVLHITATNFNHSSAVNLVAAHSRAVSIHGCGPSSCSTNTICVGGKNIITKQTTIFRNYVNDYKALVPEPPLIYAFKAPEPPDDMIEFEADANTTCDPSVKGDADNNIVNLASIREGLQLEMRSNIRNKLADSNDVAQDLLRGVVYGGVAKALAELPVPLVTLNSTESYTVRGKTFTRYKLSVENLIEYPSELFNPAPELPPCGLNNNSSRTWVHIYNAINNQYIYGFCALPSPQSLDSIWFAVEQGQIPPQLVYVSLIDRETNRSYRSNRVQIPNP